MLQRIKWPLFLIAGLMFGLKTYIVYRFVFTISLENMMQEIILFINPFATALVFFSLAVLMKPETQKKFIKYGALIGTLVIYVNLAYYRNFTDFITLPSLFQFKNFSDLGSSAASLTQLGDLLLFLDVVILFYLAKKTDNRLVKTYQRKGKLKILALSFSLLLTNVVLAEIERPMLFLRGFDREYLVKNIGLFNYHIYDIVINSKTKVQRVLADGSELVEIEEYVNENIEQDTKSDMWGIAKDKNIIYISLESVQSFVINETLNGEEITPFLNDLIEDSYYFENFYHQTNLGKTSDSEFLVETGLYPLPNSSVFFTHGQNEYNAVPEIIKENGYYSAVFHANNKSFWNRDVAYESLGFDQFFAEEYYNVTEENSIGWGLNDKEFFEQSIKYMEELPKPFYTKFITLTNHHPFELDEQFASIDQFDSNSNTVNQYFPTVRYTDEAVKQFFDLLKQSGLYEESIIVLYGDHYGISEYHNEAMGQFLGKELTPYDSLQLQRVPLIIHIPGHEDDRVIDKISAQIDMKPTLLNMLGIENNNDLTFGTDLFAEDRKPFISFRNGDFVTNDYLFTKGTCYDRQTGEPVDDVSDDSEETTEESLCAPYKQSVLDELGHSDDLIYGDLLRFYDFSKGTTKEE
ncbi:phosphoglycerol transferase MdoB-like AlkP superfamily enzyme [Salirhabdus euzebyi]|uniref:Phosphoglycerol transferase MdoB-like AlkP superfamily enzyme n=1 Tax=Salirhabdus euzebyi TaxID=394506 RepID=A0A841Q788_9BACI|nr:LTA synthase family protein [Salirhabdus euzebyi]MBB6454268.1 phosphoglycerol transferase MdoB-like AlkP superfamily enzyme [Salirhabdus euzebyi]